MKIDAIYSDQILDVIITPARDGIMEPVGNGFYLRRDAETNKIIGVSITGVEAIRFEQKDPAIYMDT